MSTNQYRYYWHQVVALALFISCIHISSTHGVDAIKSLATGFDDHLGVKMRGNETDIDFLLTAYSGTNEWPVLRGDEYPTVFRPLTIRSYLPDGVSNRSAWVTAPLAPGFNQNLQGLYTFETAFNIDDVESERAFVSGFRFAADNQLIGISVNRVDVYVPRYNRSAEEFENWHELDSFGHGLFRRGINFVEYRFHNEESSPSPMGFRIEGSVLSPSAGDFDGDGELSPNDIDALTIAIDNKSADDNFDLNNDGKLDDSDRAIWIDDMRRTWLGDANLDGEFNSSDMVTVFKAAQYEDGVAKNSTWGTGDWNGDLEFDSTDFIVAFRGDGYETGIRPSRGNIQSVPEPANPVFEILSVLTLGLLRRRSE